MANCPEKDCHQRVDDVHAEVFDKPDGYKGNRNGGSTETYWSLDSSNVYNHGFVVISTYLADDLDDENTIKNTVQLCEFAAQYGAIIYILAHNTTECTIAQWRLILDTIKEYNDIYVLSQDAALDMIRDGGDWVTADNITYTRTFTDESNYYPLNKSVWCAGTPVFVHGDGDQYAWTQDGGKELVWSDTTDAYTRCPAIGAFINPKEVPISIVHE